MPDSIVAICSACVPVNELMIIYLTLEPAIRLSPACSCQPRSLLSLEAQLTPRQARFNSRCV